MQQATIAEVLDETIRRESAHYRIYLVREGDTVFYVGQASSIYDRLESHMGMDDRHKPSVLGRFVHRNLPVSREWTVELYSLEDCEERTIKYMIERGCVWFDKDIYYNAGGGIDFSEQALISLHHPCLNTTYNTDPSPIPERYQRT